MSDATARVMPETFRARLLASHDVTPRVKLFTFERTDAQPFRFLSGQWVSVVLPLNDDKGRPVRRSYSVASVPQGSSRFELVVTRVDNGVGSTFLHQASDGTELEFKGPQGTFVRTPEHTGPALFICTGTGVAPFRGMLHDAMNAESKTPVTLLFGVRSPQDLLFADEFRSLAQQHAHFQFQVSLSQPPPEWTGLTGYVQTHVERLWRDLERHGAPHAYICGVRKMLFAARDVLKGPLLVERQRIHVESYD